MCFSPDIFVTWFHTWKKNVLLKNFLCFSPKCLFSCIHKIKTPAMFFQKKKKISWSFLNWTFLIHTWKINYPEKLLFTQFYTEKYSPEKFSQKKIWREILCFLSEIFHFFPKYFWKKSNLKFSLVENFTVKPSEKISLVNVIKTSRFFSCMKSNERKIY